MSLRIDETLEAFVSKIISNKEIMNILKLPTINQEDTLEIKKKKRKLLIDKVITKSSQEPYEVVNVISLILQVKNLRAAEVKMLAQGHMA